MIPVQLNLTGFLSYQEPVHLDFTSFNLACISGQNGAGKSSLLDAITWALFGEARRRDDALINSHAKAAEVVYDFRYEGGLYRVQRSKPRDKTTMLEFFICDDDGAWRPLTEKSVRETEKRIESTLRMDYDTFTNASFLLQGRADQFAQQRPGDRKRVLSNILGLEVWEEYRAAAAEQRRQAELDLKSVDGQIEEIDAELAQEDARKTRLSEAEARLEQLAQLRQAKESGLAAMQKLAAGLEEQRRLVDVLAQAANDSRLRCGRLEADLEHLAAERGAHQQTAAQEAEITAAYNRWQELRAELARWDSDAASFREVEARRSGPLTAISAEAQRIDGERRALAAQEAAVAQEAARLPALEAQAADAAARIAVLEAQVGGRSDLETAVHETQGRAADAKAENATLKQAMNELKERIKRLLEVEGAACPLCGQPMSPAERAALISGLEANGKEMGDRFRANLEVQAQAESRVKALREQVAGLAKAEEELRALTRQHDRLEGESQRAAETLRAWQAGGAVQLAEVIRLLAEEDFALEARRALAEIDEQLRQLGYDPAAHDAVRQAELAGRASEARLRALEAARAALAPLDRQIAGLEAQIAQERARLDEQEAAHREAQARYAEQAAQVPDINQVERDVYTIKSEENRLRMDVGMLRQQVTVLAALRERRGRLAVQRAGHAAQIARLKTLERAFSKDGVPALLIEQALPEIEAQANEILDRLSAGTMSVRFATQRQYKDKNRDDRRETLDIIISDAAGEREYELFSGGEAFRVNFAIRLALSRVLAQRSGARLQTLVIDEGFGSQDASGRQRLIEAINMVKPDFEKILVITHMEELKEAFPARIEVEKGPTGSRVLVLA